MAADTCRQLSLSEVPSWEQAQISSSLCTLMLPHVAGEGVGGGGDTTHDSSTLGDLTVSHLSLLSPQHLSHLINMLPGSQRKH